MNRPCLEAGVVLWLFSFAGSSASLWTVSANQRIDASFMRIGKIDDPEPPPYARASYAERLSAHEALKDRLKDLPVMRVSPPPSGARRWPTIREILNAFGSHKVQFIVVGGYAVIFHGYVRTTEDIDLYVNPSPQNAETIVAAFRSLDFSHPELTVEFLTKAGSVFRFGRIPEQTELLLQVKGITWDDAWNRSIQHELMGVQVRFLDLENLIKSKQAAGRLQDLADIEKLREIQRDSWLRDE